MLSFLNYLKVLGVENAPGKSTLYNNLVLIDGEYPEWEFADNPATAEVIRRRNVGKRFVNAYQTAKRELVGRISGK